MKKCLFSFSVFAIVAIAATSMYFATQNTNAQDDLLQRNVEALSQDNENEDPGKRPCMRTVHYESNEWGIEFDIRYCGGCVWVVATEAKDPDHC